MKTCKAADALRAQLMGLMFDFRFENKIPLQRDLAAEWLGIHRDELSRIKINRGCGTSLDKLITLCVKLYPTLTIEIVI